MNHTITTVNGDLVDLFYETVDRKYCPDYIKVDGIFLPGIYRKFAEAIDNFDVRNDDVWICTFPKTGTTWTQEMIWCIANDLDFERAKVPLTERFPFLEYARKVSVRFIDIEDCLDRIKSEINNFWGESQEKRKQSFAGHPKYIYTCLGVEMFDDSLELAEVCIFVDFDAVQREHPEVQIPRSESESISWIEELPSPRFIKTHLPFHLLPRQIRSGEKNPRIISVFRNAKDSCISYYHHCILLEGYRGSFEDFCKLFLGDCLNFAPFWTNVLSYWRKRIQDNVLILNFEDMKRDLPSTIRKTAKFLGKNLTSDQVSTLNEHLSFASMKKNPAVNNEALIAICGAIFGGKQNGSFIRSGTSEQWKTEMTPEIVKQFDDWIQHHLKGTHLSF